jgi:hypoxanthine phosphoribosyltransferase
MKKRYVTDQEIKRWTHNIVREINNGGWRPDYVVGLTRGGLAPAVMISHYLDIPMHTLDVSFRDADIGPESNLWMAEDAYGYVAYEGTVPPPDRVTTDAALRKNILIVDDINDTGRTLNWIKEDWPSGCLPADPAWESIWHSNVRFAVMVDNQGSSFSECDYVGITIDKREDDEWIVFPWENWWER